MGGILVLGGIYGSYGRPVEHLGRLTEDLSLLDKNPQDIDLVMFKGGEDVYPLLYGGLDEGMSSYNKRRDAAETIVFQKCVENGIKMTGICRGAQFLNVMCGGKMYQDVSGHATGQGHRVRFLEDGQIYVLPSTHHQMVLPPPGSYLTAVSDENRSRYFIGPNSSPVAPPNVETEGYTIPEFKVMGVQFHPEMLGSEAGGYIHYQYMVEHFLSMDPYEFAEKFGRLVDLRADYNYEWGEDRGTCTVSA